MTKTPREKAIEAVAEVLYSQDNSRHQGKWSDFDKYNMETLYYKKAEAVIDFLNIEFVDGESGVEIGDIYKAIYKRDAGHGDYIEEELVERLSLGERKKWLKDVEIIQRNGKPVINIDEQLTKEDNYES